MKRIIKISVVSLVVTVLLMLSAVGAFAAEDATVNGKPAKVGDTVTYTFSISDCVQKLVGIDARFFFDQSALEIVSVKCDNLGDGAIVNANENKDGIIYVNSAYISGSTKGLDCSNKTELVTIEFKVLKAADTEVTYYIPYIYDFDLVNLYKYTFSYDLTVAGNIVINNETPVLADDKEIDKLTDKGDFENNPEGTGSGIKPTEAPTESKAGADSQQSSNSASQQSSNSASQQSSNSASQQGTQSAGDEKNNNTDGGFNIWFVVIPVIVLVVAGIVVLIVLRYRQSN